MTVADEIARLTLPDRVRRFAIVMVASEGDVHYASRQSGVTNGEDLLSSPLVQQYIELLRLRKIEIIGEEDQGLRESLATREEAGRFLTDLLRDPEASTREKLAATKMYLADFKPASAEKKQLVSIKEVGRLAEEEIG